MAQQTAEISTATVKNFVLLAKDWFKADFSENFSLCLPLAFLSGPTKVQTVVTGGEQKLIDYLNGLAAKQPSREGWWWRCVRNEIRDKRETLGGGGLARLGGVPS